MFHSIAFRIQSPAHECEDFLIILQFQAINDQHAIYLATCNSVEDYSHD